MSKQAIVNLAGAASLSATTTSSSVDISDLTGNATLVLNSSATGGAGQTLDVKLQHSSDDSSYSDAGIAFTQVTNAAASFQTVNFSVDGLKKYVKVVSTLGGSSPTVVRSVSLVGTKAY